MSNFRTGPDASERRAPFAMWTRPVPSSAVTKSAITTVCPRSPYSSEAKNENGGSYGKTSPLVYSKLTSDHPIDLCRYQVANCYMGRSGLINSGGASSGATDLAEAVRTAVINKRAGGTGLISGRKAFQRPMPDGVEILNAIQDVYLSDEVTIA